MPEIIKTDKKLMTRPDAEFVSTMYVIEKRRRFGLLRKFLGYGSFISLDELAIRRKAFDEMKHAFSLNRRCYLCERKKTRDRYHIVPLHKGGENSLDNLVGLCRECHRSLSLVCKTKKFKKHFKQAMAKLIVKSKAPRPIKPRNPLSSFSGCFYVPSGGILTEVQKQEESAAA